MTAASDESLPGHETISDLMAAMAEAGAPMAAILIAVRAIEARDLAEEKRLAAKREGNAERQRRHRATKAYQSQKVTRDDVLQDGRVTRDEALQCCDTPPPSPSPSLPPKITNQTPHPTPTTPPTQSSLRSDSPQAILAEVVTPQTAADIVAHRKALRKPLTSGAARRLAKTLFDYGDPEGGANAMIANGWQGFNPDWMAQRGVRAGPQRHDTRDGLATVFRETMERVRNDERQGRAGGNGNVLSLPVVSEKPGPNGFDVGGLLDGLKRFP